MSIEYICDGCGKREAAAYSKEALDPSKPYEWFGKRDKATGRWLHACSRPCIKIAADKFATDDIVLPV